MTNNYVFSLGLLSKALSPICFFQVIIKILYYIKHLYVQHFYSKTDAAKGTCCSLALVFVNCFIKDGKQREKEVFCFRVAWKDTVMLNKNNQATAVPPGQITGKKNL